MLLSKALMMGGGTPGSYWIALLGGTGDDVGRSVTTDSADNIIVCGETASDGAGADDLLVAKYDSSGTLQWDRTLGGIDNDRGDSVTTDSADNIIVSGDTESDGVGRFDLLVVKYDSFGTLQWDRTLGGPDFEFGQSVTTDSADNIIVCGQTDSEGAGDINLLVAKYNSAGALQWDRTLGGNSGFSFGRSVTTDSADNIIVCGDTDSEGAGSDDLLVAKYNSTGTLQWDRTLGGTDNDYGLSVTTDSADNIIVCGYTYSDGAGNADLLIAKYDSAGTLQWDRTLGGSDNEFGQSVTTDSADNIIVCGQTDSDGAGSDDLLIAKYDSSGTLQWGKTLGGTGADLGDSVTTDSADNIIVCGVTASDGAGGDDLLVAKLPPDGTGNGTYGSLTYQDAVFTDSAAALTDDAAGLTNSTTSFTDASATLTDAAAVLTETFYEVS